MRDLPRKELGVDIENGFEPTFVTIRGKGKIITDLKRMAKNADKIILATDPDREGEAIAYHVAEQLGYEKDPSRFERVAFREITKSAVQEALRSPGPLDLKRIEAQQARRILDRLV
ncbi:MAG: toprim domain-containing protein, partial [Gemmatimonadetes bacterium]|nr:toprim domain-containing protein [Gemmatimonadota bacterium]